LTLDEKLECVLLHLNDNLPLYTISKERGINVARLKYCIDLYKKWGEVAFKKKEERRTYTRETKLKAIEDHIVNGRSFRKIAIDLMLTEPNIVSDWVNMYKEKGEEAIKDTYSREAYKHHNDKVLEKEYKKILEDLQITKAENERRNVLL
ncbi:MAG: transposase, partial [Candidatus Onthovivens sp.]|nr:transposase [Candidatus Onthovivens sp.]